MSFEYYANWWIKSKKKFEDLTEKDENIGNKFKPINERNLANALVGGLYAKYCMIVQDLVTCVDQMAQPQKRISAKKLVDSACIRLNELNDELRKISISEFHYIDGSLVELKLIPYDIEILHPCLFHHRPVKVEEMVQRIKETYKERDLIEVLQGFKINEEYMCDELATENGLTVLGRPIYYCVINPDELIWHKVKSNIRRDNIPPHIK